MTAEATRPLAPATPALAAEQASTAERDSAGRGRGLSGRLRRTSRRARGSRLSRVLVTLSLLAIGVVFLYPFAWLVSASLKPRGEVFDNKLIPDTASLDNYLQVWVEAPMTVWLANTVLVTVLAAVTVTISSALVAWGFAHYRFRGRRALFGLVLATMMLPGAVTMIPTFLIWNALGQTGSLTPLWAGNIFGSAFYIFLMRQFFLGLPREIFEAARIDGAGHFRMFWSMALPLAKPAVVITLLFETQAAWTDLMRPLIYLRDVDTFTIPRGLKALVDQFALGGEFNWQLVIAASVVTTLPMIVLFFFGQRYFVDGVATTGLKG